MTNFRNPIHPALSLKELHPFPRQCPPLIKWIQVKLAKALSIYKPQFDPTRQILPFSQSGTAPFGEAYATFHTLITDKSHHLTGPLAGSVGGPMRDHPSTPAR
jgi:hypothetical protein